LIYEAYCDAGLRTRDRKTFTFCACGAILYLDGLEIARETRFLGSITINAGEYSGLILALDMALTESLGIGDEISIYSDSKLVVMQVLGLWCVRERSLMPYRTAAHRLASRLRSRGCIVRIFHVSRTQNGHADAMVAELLDEITKKKRR
jgi:ribonuclease HI